jgi:hypothetical protein
VMSYGFWEDFRPFLGMVQIRLTLLRSSKPEVSITQARFLNLADYLIGDRVKRKDNATEGSSFNEMKMLPNDLPPSKFFNIHF